MSIRTLVNVCTLLLSVIMIASLQNGHKVLHNRVSYPFLYGEKLFTIQCKKICSLFFNKQRKNSKEKKTNGGYHLNC